MEREELVAIKGHIYIPIFVPSKVSGEQEGQTRYE
jgi:hypothetical protein